MRPSPSCSILRSWILLLVPSLWGPPLWGPPHLTPGSPKGEQPQGTHSAPPAISSLPCFLLPAALGLKPFASNHLRAQGWRWDHLPSLHHTAFPLPSPAELTRVLISLYPAKTVP